MVYDPATLLPAYVPDPPPGKTLEGADHDESLHELDRQELRGLKTDFGLTASAGSLQGYTRLSNAAGQGLWVPSASLLGLSPVINGGMAIWQENTSFAAAADGQACAEMFFYKKSGAMVHTVSRDTNVPAVSALHPLFNYSTLIDCTTVDAAIAAGDYCYYEYRMEGFDWLLLAQRAFAIGFWVMSPKTGTHCVAFSNSGQDRSYVAEFTVSVADTWEYKVVAVSASPSAGTWNYLNATGLRIRWALAAGTTYQTTAGAWNTGNFLATSNQQNLCDNTANNFRITGVQPIVGTVGVPFAPAPVAIDRLRAMRYWEKGTNDTSVYPANNDTISFTTPLNTTPNGQQYGQIRFQVVKRAAPAVTIRPFASTTSSTGVVSNNSGSDRAANSGVAVSINDKQFGIQNNSGGDVVTSLNLLLFAWNADIRLT